MGKYSIQFAYLKSGGLEVKDNYLREASREKVKNHWSICIRQTNI